MNSINSNHWEPSAGWKPSAHWKPTARIEVLHARAALLKKIRLFFEDKNVLEVETPNLSCAATTDPYIESFLVNQPATPSTQNTTSQFTSDPPRYLHTSPEMPMKRLLAAGSGAIYQLCKVFRPGEQGRLHNCEFTMLEWYRPGMPYRELMEEVAQLIEQVLPEDTNMKSPEYLSYRAAFEKFVNIDPFDAPVDALIACAANAGIGSVVGLPSDDRDAWLNVLLTHCIEPHLGDGKLSFLFDFPISQASLAQIRADVPPVAERFELYFRGVELANGFQELTDSDTQRMRFQEDLQQRRDKSLATVPIDENMLAALAHGLPRCAGVALGIDRLLMIMLGAERIEHVISFPFERA